MGKWQRIKYQPNLPLYPGEERVTGSKKHIELSRKAAGEGMVLLKNENSVLPFQRGTKVALFGKGSVDYVRGGGGSGMVYTAYERNLWEGMKIKEREGKIILFPELEEFYERELKKQYEEGAVCGMTKEPEIPEELLKKARVFTDTAVISICRFSGESWDRNGDFYLTFAEEAMVETVKKNFAKVVVVLNVGGVMDTTWFQSCQEIQAALMAWQAGIEGGLAIADILCADVIPSGKLADTFAFTLEDYPSTANFHESIHYVDYTEDVYVGYRYFETMAGAKEKVTYPFGFGLSYTEFNIDVIRAEYGEDGAEFLVQVYNLGSYPGKEVVQIYYSAPQGKLGKPSRALIGFQKTRLLKPGESQCLKFAIPYDEMASYDDLGKVCKSAYVLEPGEYRFYIGNSVAEAKEATGEPFILESLKIVKQCTAKAAPHKLSKRLLADGSYESLPMDDGPEEEPGLLRQDRKKMEGIAPEVRRIDRKPLSWAGGSEPILLKDVAEGKHSLKEFMEQLSEEELVFLLGGQPNTGVANTFGMGNLPEYGVPNVMTADGPAGLRIEPECGVSTTAWPCATLMACTWNPELTEEVGRGGAEEVKENNLGIWLAPAMNIHRNPLCGRNFEYYSEDPFLAGKIGAAMVRGIQSVHIGASVKHFACNNKETNRKNSDSRVSERALREIYLKAFEIVVKEAKPYTVMSSYNLLNGVHTSENKDLFTGILRKEWGYEGIVTTDWWTCAEHYREIKAGNDIKMANGYPERVLEALEKGYITKEEIVICARRVLEMILKID